MSNPQSGHRDISTYGILQPAFTPHADYQRTDSRPVQPQSGIGNDADWPYHSFLELSALPTAASCARLHATAMLAEWGMADLRDEAEAVVSELASNAFLAAAMCEDAPAVQGSGPALILLWLLGDKSRLIIVVWDASRQPPVLREPSQLDEHGRGLLIVSELSHAWGYYARPGAAGKYVWAEIKRSPNRGVA